MKLSGINNGEPVICVITQLLKTKCYICINYYGSFINQRIYLCYMCKLEPVKAAIGLTSNAIRCSSLFSYILCNVLLFFWLFDAVGVIYRILSL